MSRRPDAHADGPPAAPTENTLPGFAALSLVPTEPFFLDDAAAAKCLNLSIKRNTEGKPDTYTFDSLIAAAGGHTLLPVISPLEGNPTYVGVAQMTWKDIYKGLIDGSVYVSGTSEGTRKTLRLSETSLQSVVEAMSDTDKGGRTSVGKLLSDFEEVKNVQEFEAGEAFVVMSREVLKPLNETVMESYNYGRAFNGTDIAEWLYRCFDDDDLSTRAMQLVMTLRMAEVGITVPTIAALPPNGSGDTAAANSRNMVMIHPTGWVPCDGYISGLMATLGQGNAGKLSLLNSYSTFISFNVKHLAQRLGHAHVVSADFRCANIVVEKATEPNVVTNWRAIDFSPDLAWRVNETVPIQLCAFLNMYIFAASLVWTLDRPSDTRWMWSEVATSLKELHKELTTAVADMEDGKSKDAYEEYMKELDFPFPEHEFHYEDCPLFHVMDFILAAYWEHHTAKDGTSDQNNFSWTYLETHLRTGCNRYREKNSLLNITTTPPPSPSPPPVVVEAFEANHSALQETITSLAKQRADSVPRPPPRPPRPPSSDGYVRPSKRKKASGSSINKGPASSPPFQYTLDDLLGLMNTTPSPNSGAQLSTIDSDL